MTIVFCYKNRSFTLVELLVVVAIIAVLAALLMPSLFSALKLANTAKCLNNQKQIGLGVTLFADDHNGYCPGAAYTGGYGAGVIISFIGGNSSNGELMSLGYLPNDGVYKCPTAMSRSSELLAGMAWVGWTGV